MARIRTIKPEFFRHEALYEAEHKTGLPLRVAYAGLWTAADREGRFQWKPRQLKLDCLPYDDVDFEAVLVALASSGFIVPYEHEGHRFGYIPSWHQHQIINQREAKSKLPDPAHAMPVHAHALPVHAHASPTNTPNGINVPQPLRETVLARDKKCVRCGATENLTIDHIFPRSMGGTHALTNLRTLCQSCNSARPVAGQALIDDLAKDGLTLDDMPRMCMHVQTHGEGKGKEEEREKNKNPSPSERAAPNGAHAGVVVRAVPSSPPPAQAPTEPATPDAELYRRGKQVLGKNAGGLITDLLRAKDGSVALARAAIETASTKHDPREYIGAIIRGKPDEQPYRVIV